VVPVRTGTALTVPNHLCQTSEVRVRGIVNRENRLPLHLKFFAKCERPAAGCGVRYEHAVGERAYEPVSGVGKSGGDSLVLWLERRQNQQTSGGKGGLELGLEVHADDTAGRNPDHGLATTEQDAEAFPFHRSVESSDQRAALIAHRCDGVELQDHSARALGRTEESRLIAAQNA